MADEKKFIVTYDEKIWLMLQDYKKKFSLSNNQLAMVLGVSAPTVGRWLKGALPKKNSLKERVSRLLSLDFFNDDMSQVIDGYHETRLELSESVSEPVVYESSTITPDGEKNSVQAEYEPCTWSVSRVKTWLDNPWDFYCKYVKGLKKNSPWQDALDRGTILHRILELLATSPHDIDFLELHLSTIQQAVKAYNTLIENGEKKIPPQTKSVLIKNIYEAEEKISKLEPIQQISDKGFEDGFRVARKYLDYYGTIHNMGKVLEAEKKIEWDLSEYLPNQSFVGYIDAVVEDGRGKIWLVDHKTYSNKPKFEDLRMELQANVYMYVMKHVYGVDVAGFIYDCINPKEKIVGRGYHFHQFKINYNERIVEMVVENFLTTIEIILNNQDYTMYKASEYGTAFTDELVHGFDGQYVPNITGLDDSDE